MQANPQGRISTFYSYKGGTGRTMALANVAWILASKGKRVLAIDWDLEAPGLHRYFAPLLGDPKLASSPGLIDFLLEYWIAATRPGEDDDDDPRWFERYADLAGLALPVLADFPGGGRLDVIGAGQQDGGYAERVTSFDWKAFYASFGGAGFLDLTFDRLRAEYDYVLIDSRTGVSDTAGICTVQLPDSLVVFFTLNNQSIEGASAIAHDALAQRRGVGRARLAVFPVPSRIDLFERDKLEIRRSLVRERFTDLLDLDESARKRYFAEIELLYVPFYSYEEQLATIVDGPNQRASLLGSLERLTGHVSAGEVQQLVPISDALRADFRAKYDAFHRGQIPAPGGEPDERWDIFLSHADEDHATARALHRQLQPRFKTFYADEVIAVGQNIAETTARAMANSHIAVILISRAALASAALAGEVERLLAAEAPTRRTLTGLRTKRVLPVLIGVEPDELPESLARLRAYRALVVPADDQAPIAAARSIITALGETPETMTSSAGASQGPKSSQPQATSDEPTQFLASRRLSRLWVPGLVVVAFVVLVMLVMPTGSGGTSGISNLFSAGRSNELRLQRRLDRKTEELRTANDATNRERGLRATLLARDRARVIEALMLGAQAVYPTISDGMPPPEATTGLLAALTQLGSDATLRHVLSGHRGGISTLLYAGGGSTIASVDGSGVVRTWDSQTGKLSATLNEHGLAPTHLAITDDGSRIAWSTNDAIVHVWRIDKNEELASFGPLPNEVRDLAFWDEDANVAIATSKNVHVYELATQRELWAAPRPPDYRHIGLAERTRHYAYDNASAVEVFSLDPVHRKLWPTRLAKLTAPVGLTSVQVLAERPVTDDGLAGDRYVLMATQSRVEVHNVTRNEWVAWLESPLTSRPQIATAAAAPVVAAGWSEDVIVQVWSAEQGTRNFRAADEGIAGLALAPDGSRLAVLDRNGTIQIWQLDSLRRLTAIAGDTSVSTMVFGPDGERLVTGSSDGTARLWNLRQRKSWNIADPGQPLRALTMRGSVVTGLLVTSGTDRITRVWDLRRRSEVSRFETKSVVTTLTLIPGRGSFPRTLVMTSVDGPTRWIDLDTFEVRELEDESGSSIGGLSLAVSDDGYNIALGDPEGVVHVWDREGKLLTTLAAAAPGGVELLAFSPDGKHLATSQDRTIAVRQIHQYPKPKFFEGHLSSVKSLSFSPDGNWIASSSGDPVARLWTLDGSKSLILEGHTAPLTTLAFFPDGRRVITASEDSTARIWAFESGELEVSLDGHAGPIRKVDLTLDGESIVTASDDGTARLWANDGSLVASLIGHRSGVVEAGLTEDGKLLITASSDGDLRGWPTTPWDAWMAGCDELYERAEYSQVDAFCMHRGMEQHANDDGDKPKIDPVVRVLQLDPVEVAPAPKPTGIQRPPKNPPGTPQPPSRRYP